MPSPHTDVTELLLEAQDGNQEALDALLPLLYKELRRIAAVYLRGERRNHTLQPTALVHEAFMRLVPRRDLPWQSRAHFLNTAAQVMRRILVDHARERLAGKRGHLLATVALEDASPVAVEREVDLLALDEALERLAKKDPQLGRVVELRYFGGLTTKEAAEVLGLSTATVEREWATARSWLRLELQQRTNR